MNDGFDPYYEWLGIPPRDQPPNWYRLLGIEQFEANANVIERAADRQMGHLRTFQTGARSKESQRLLNEVAAARVGLLSPARKAAYDEQLRAEARAAFPAFELPPLMSPIPPTIAGFDPPPPPALAATAAANPTPATKVSRPIPAPLRTHRFSRRPQPIWKQPGVWGVMFLLLVLLALLGFAAMLFWELPFPSWFPLPPPTT